MGRRKRKRTKESRRVGSYFGRRGNSCRLWGPVIHQRFYFVFFHHVLFPFHIPKGWKQRPRLCRNLSRVEWLGFPEWASPVPVPLPYIVPVGATAVDEIRSGLVSSDTNPMKGRISGSGTGDGGSFLCYTVVYLNLFDDLRDSGFHVEAFT